MCWKCPYVQSHGERSFNLGTLIFPYISLPADSNKSVDKGQGILRLSELLLHFCNGKTPDRRVRPQYLATRVSWNKHLARQELESIGKPRNPRLTCS
mmetsp:Transcript_60758/g.114580  ORF Transcript_60758/g.114580 Transcript_60758/m.114580 type:complete len:97 (+) Transcript_60758:38-328(+)